MAQRKIGLGAVAAFLMVLGMAASAWAQPGGGFGGPGGGGGGRGGRGGGPGGPPMDPAQMQQMFMERIKTQLNSPDDEWKVIQPAVEKVMTTQRETRGGFGFGGRGGPGGPGGMGGGQAPTSALGRAMQDLQALLQNPNIAQADVGAKLNAVREARNNARESLKKSQKELLELLTARQEAELVMMGILE